MALATSKQRRPPTSSSPSTESYTKEDKPEKKLDGGEKTDDGSMSWKLPFFPLVTLRYMSATSNIIHNCNEVFNYWEPLHFLLFKSGFQTWEYRVKVGLLPFVDIVVLASENNLLYVSSSCDGFLYLLVL
ncbi:dol-P-Man:Man(6)GlcNAc(2)-PP-Dol alpha-1,2-mannosyltransferase-like [Magnolia sinica]|uniref:dol-P-Man:Man(6)GlcNAc(2)-PP-Dol alpha-1,2-mannosyltransferase-like n=1 Tax=Magnolia sinica TaxID=86752 RepID=UPI002657F1F3|nr:dol-P-Man:Man(6)GlcNAc(2)-PP-Dol alpha-1,2-mannosyltransferase-like [Magnolia sinica]